MSGAISYHAGVFAETAVARRYEASGHRMRARRWRGQGGEIDLVFERGEEVVFVEVKKSRSFAAAARALRPAQVSRLLAAGAEYLGNLPRGSLTPARFDVALVNADSEVELIENALWA